MSVYLTPVLSGDLCAFFGKPNARYLSGDANMETKAFAKRIGLKTTEVYRDVRALDRLDRYVLSPEEAAAAIEAGAVEETFPEYQARVDRRAELLRENARDDAS